MRCTHPVLLKQGFPVPCGRCIACRINKTSEWTSRLYMELGYYDKACFITLTYDPEFYPSDGSLNKRDFQLFMKRVRKRFGSDLKFFACGEYGDTTMRCHFHAILFGVDFQPWVFHHFERGRKIFTSPTLSDLWKLGFVTVDDVTVTDINYVTGYVRKKLYGDAALFYKDLGILPPFQLFSKGLGQRYVDDNSNRLLQFNFFYQNGKKVPLPRYAQKKLGLRDVDEFGHSELFYRAQDIIAERRQKFLDEDHITDKYGFDGQFSDDSHLDFDYACYKRSCDAQRDVELQVKDPERNIL